ncbi:MAG: 30S ribosomal protein S2 [Chitinophagales bacterium]|nr:30S ribosomal protein S2 [Chitinophagales bacterium]MDW8419891.1 30S ribosomal protein S2 [Chitinophagales bacterium]
MEKLTHKALLDAQVHFGHLRRKWNPKMLPYIFGEQKGIHIIDLNRTMEKLEEAAAAARSIAKSGRKILFVATKKQAKDVVKQAALRVGMPYVTERWLGGMLTNFITIRKSIKKMQSIEKMLTDGTLENATKKEKLVLTREKEKMEKVLGGVANLNRVPAALFLVDIIHEHIALKEAQRLNINTIGIVDTNSDPTKLDFPIPGNDDAATSIAILTNYIADAIAEGLAERAASNEGSDYTVEDEETGDKPRYEAEVTDEDTGEDSGKTKSRKRGAGGAGRSRSRAGASSKK